MIKSFKQSLVDHGIEEFHFSWTFSSDIIDAVLDHIFYQLHIVFKIRKSDLRFDHPELRRMSLGVGVLRSESRTEGIDISEGHRKSFNMKLSGYRQRSMLAKEIFFILAVVSGRDRKDFTGTFRIIACNDWRMYIDKTLTLEEFMNGHSQS